VFGKIVVTRRGAFLKGQLMAEQLVEQEALLTFLFAVRIRGYNKLFNRKRIRV
jgi:hypothetical protein